MGCRTAAAIGGISDAPGADVAAATWDGIVEVGDEPGRYTYVFDPHSRDMIGSFRVR